MMIVAMDKIGQMLPLIDPIANGSLKSQEPFGIVGISVDLFSVEQSIDINQVQVES